MTQEELFQM